jgi:ribosome-associated toxin RatA of RatAB toxin-antitoxin module
MPSVSKTQTFSAPIENVYKVLIDYASYPEYMDGVSAVKIIEQTDSTAKIEYSLNLIKKFSYVLNLEQTEPNRVSWTFDSGDIFKVNTGSWDLVDNGDGTTEVTYTLEVEVKVFAPKMVVNKLTEKSLPNLMAQVDERAQSLG